MTKELLKQCYDELAKLNGLVVKSEGVDCKFDDLLDALSKEIIKEETTIKEYFDEWNYCVKELVEKEIQLASLKETYNQKEFEIVFMSTDIDWKELYGSTSEKVRKQHATNQLKEMNGKKTELEISIGYLKRRIDYIKSLMAIEIALIKYSGD